MRYVIMANGKGRRWSNHRGIPKHLIEVDGETILSRTVRLIHELDPQAEVIISSCDLRCEVEGARRYEPLRNECEIDRFVFELIIDNTCFVYGDTYYTKHAMETIVNKNISQITFFGSSDTVFAVKAQNAELMKDCVEGVRNLFLSGLLDTCKGWQLYQLYANVPFGKPVVGDHFVLLEDETRDFNSPDDLYEFMRARSGSAISIAPC